MKFLHQYFAPHAVAVVGFFIAVAFFCMPAAFLLADDVSSVDTARAATASAEPMELQLPVEFPSEQAEAMGGRVYVATEKQAHYLLSLVHPWDKDPDLKLLTESRSLEHWIRPNTGAVAGFAMLYGFGPYDEKIVGVDRQTLLDETIVPMMRYLVETHKTGSCVTGDGKPWGDHWQSAHWANHLAHAAWWIWDDLPEDVREGVQKVVAHEADRFVGAKPPIQLKLDTKAEENAWNAQILSIAVLLMPDDRRAGDWEREFQRWCMSSFQRAADAECETVVDGRPVREQFFGANVHDDFTLENHGFVHPDYMSCFSLSLGCELDFMMTGRTPPESVRWNVEPIYENLKWFTMPDGGYVYPSGQDWTLFRCPGSLGLHGMMAVYCGDGDAWSLCGPPLDTLEKMQARSPMGNIYDTSEYFFPSTQSDRIFSLARTWMMLHYASDIKDQPVEREGVLYLEPGKIIINRQKDVIHTLSWGERLMTQCVPLRKDRVVSPDTSSGIGYIRLAGESKSLPKKLVDVDVKKYEDAFSADLTIEHGDAVVARVSVESLPDGRFRIIEMLIAARDIEVDVVATGLVGVLNNRKWVYEDGSRTIKLDDEEHIVKALSGDEILGEAEQIVVDDVLRIERLDKEKPLSIGYRAAIQPERGRATDELFLNYLRGKKKFAKGDVISQWGAEISVLEEK